MSKTPKKEKLDPSDPLTPVRIFQAELDAMNKRAPEVIRLAYSRGAKVEQLSAVLGVSERTIYNRLEGLGPKGAKNK